MLQAYSVTTQRIAACFSTRVKASPFLRGLAQYTSTFPVLLGLTKPTYMACSIDGDAGQRPPVY
jgi:hypothetical protein